MILIILKFICLLLAVLYGFSNIGKIVAKCGDISNAQILMMAIGVVGFIFLQFKLYL